VTGPEAAAIHAALYGPSADELRRSLPEIGDGLQAQLHDIYFRPEPAAAEHLAANLDGARRAVLRLAEAIRREGRGDGA
jgi:hypothetical protein